MIENSYIKDEKISKSLTRLNKISSDKKFRVKSLRMKTEQKHSLQQSPQKSSVNLPSILKQNQLNSPIRKLTSIKTIEAQTLINSKLRVKSSVLQKDYESQLQSRLHFPRSIVQEIFTLKLQYQQIKPTPEKYVQFCKMLYHRLIDKVEISIQSFNLRNKALVKFLQFFIEWQQKNIISVDLSMCSQLAYKIKTKKQQEEELLNNGTNTKIKTQHMIDQPLWPVNSLLLDLIRNDNRLIKLSVRNLHLSPDQMSDLLREVLRSKRLYCLDISNKTSQSINRLGSDFGYLEAFFAKNQTLAIMKMDNLNIMDACMQKISHGITKTSTQNPLKILSLSGNQLTYQSISPIFNIMTRAALTELNLSNNPLGREFYLATKNLRASTIKSLDLSSTQMDSESLIHLMQQFSQNKALQILKLDNNDFSNHWFNKIDDVIANNLSIQSLSLVNCGIKSFSSLFEGLIHSRYLARVNLNNNVVNLEEENVQSVVNCLKTSKILQQLKMRFCGYNESAMIQVIQSLKPNQKLEMIDISENHLSDNGGKEIVKMLTENKFIKDVGIQKLQLTVRMTEQIQSLLNHNQKLREKQQFIHLIDQSQTYKARDTFSWNDINKLEQNAKKLEKLTQQCKIRNTQIEGKINQKRQAILQLRKQSKIEEKRLQKQIKKQEQQIQSMIRKLNVEIQKTNEKEKQFLEASQIEQNLIKSLENRIVKENQKIKKRQGQLQQQFRDEKYLQKKKQKEEKQQLQSKKQIQEVILVKKSSQMFDNTKGFQSLKKRKSTSIQKKS